VETRKGGGLGFRTGKPGDGGKKSQGKFDRRRLGGGGEPIAGRKEGLGRFRGWKGDRGIQFPLVWCKPGNGESLLKPATLVAPE